MSPKTRRAALIFISFLLVITAGLILLRIKGLGISPKINEFDRSSPSPLASHSSLIDSEPSLIAGLPLAKPPGYRAQNFKYVSVSAGRKLWKIFSSKTLMYDPERLVHARQITAELFDSQGKVTLITGDEAKYYLNQFDLEVYGSVHVLLPDGFEIWSDYVFYSPEKQYLTIPRQYPVRGGGKQSSERTLLEFKSQGLEYLIQKGLISLLDHSEITFLRDHPQSQEPERSSKTWIESDQSVINRKTQSVEFKMDEARTLKDRFVYITQPSLLTRARQVRLNYGHTQSLVNYLVALEDVLITEITPAGKTPLLRYATAGRAEFNAQSDSISLSEFPQLYENGDTMVGDRIVLHRDSDRVEISNSNAFSEGARRRNSMETRAGK